jgi:hypothetical protein
VIFAKIQGYPGSNTIIDAVAFLEMKQNHEGPNEASKEGGGR